MSPSLRASGLATFSDEEADFRLFLTIQKFMLDLSCEFQGERALYCERRLFGREGAPNTAHHAPQAFEIQRFGLLVVWAYLVLLALAWPHLALIGLMPAYLVL